MSSVPNKKSRKPPPRPAKAETSGQTAYLSEAQAAALIGISGHTLARLRRSGKGPSVAFSTGSQYRYRRSDVIAWRDAGGAR